MRNHRFGRQIRKSSIIVLILGMVIGYMGFYVISGGHVRDYLVWRWMVTFHRPVRPVTDYHLVVSKSAHQLMVFHGDEALRTFRIAISYHGTGPRKVWEDELTPEGSFLIASMQYISRFGSRQMLLETTGQSLEDYFTQYEDEGRQRAEAWETAHGKLDTIWEVYEFNEDNPEYPIWNDILIHGGGSDHDWTWGCIALDDPDMVELFDILKQSAGGGLGVRVEIQH